MGEACQDALRVSFDHAIKLEFHGARVSSDAGLFPFRDLDEAVQLTESSAAQLFDFRTGSNIRHAMRALLRGGNVASADNWRKSRCRIGDTARSRIEYSVSRILPRGPRRYDRVQEETTGPGRAGQRPDYRRFGDKPPVPVF